MKWLTFSLLVLLATACKQQQTVVHLNLSTKIDEHCSALEADTSRDSINFNLCKDVPFRWDTILVLPAYVPGERLKLLALKNGYILKDIYHQLNDSQITLVFIRESNIVGYSYYHCAISLYNLKFRKYHGFNILTRNICGALFIKRKKNGPNKYHFVSY